MNARFRIAWSFAILLSALSGAAPRTAQADRQPGTPPDPALFATLEKFHGHTCAGSLFGARLGSAALEALRASGGTGKVKAVYHDHSCPVDGVQVAAGVTYGNQALVVDDRDEHRLVLTAAGNGKRVEARLTAKAEEMGLRSRDLGKQARALPEGSAERGRLEREIEGILDWLRTAPTGEVVTVR